MKGSDLSQEKKWWLKWGVRFFILVLFLGASLFYALPPMGYIPVLMYHFVVPAERVGPTSLDVSLEDFQKQMWFLKTFGFRPISLDELYAIKSGSRKPMGREVVVTFDDGNETFIQFALPVLEKYQIPAANFLVWNFLQGKAHGSMSLDDAKRLAKHPLVTLGSHTLSHPILVDVSPRKARKEVVESKRRLEHALGKKVDYFSYPSGFFSPNVMEFVQEAGYRLAFTTAKKQLGGRAGTLHSLCRLKIGPRKNLLIFWGVISGIPHYGKELDVFYQKLTERTMSGKLPPYKLRPQTT